MVVELISDSIPFIFLIGPIYHIPDENIDFLEDHESTQPFRRKKL